MSDDGKDWEREARFRSSLLRWEKIYDSAIHSDRLTGEIGILVLKTTLLANGGGVIAVLPVLAGTPSTSQKIVDAFITSGIWFAVGLLAAVAVTGLSYFYQMSVTVRDWNHLADAVGGDAPNPWADKSAWVLFFIVTPLVLFAVVCFGIGIIGGVMAFAG